MSTFSQAASTRLARVRADHPMRVLAIVHHANAAAGVFGDPALAAGHELVEWLPHEAPRAGPRRLRRRDGLRRRDARGPGGRAPVAARTRSASSRAARAAARRCSASASARSSWRRRPAATPRRAERAGDRLARDRADRRGRGRPAAGRAARALRGLPVAQLRVRRRPAARRSPAARLCLPGLPPGERPVLGHPVPRRGHASPTCGSWLDDWRERRGRGAHRASTPRRSAPRAPARSAPGTSSGRALAERFLAAARESIVGRDVGADESPPSTMKVDAVTYDDSSLARKSAAWRSRAPPRSGPSAGAPAGARPSRGPSRTAPGAAGC